MRTRKNNNKKKREKKTGTCPDYECDNHRS